MSSPQVLLKNPFLCIFLFSAQITKRLFLNSLISMSPVVRPTRHSIICEAAPNKKVDSVAKRARQAEKRRVYNKARKSEVKTRMQKDYFSFEFMFRLLDDNVLNLLFIELGYKILPQLTFDSSNGIK
ncbi:hypothetical protein HYC85_002207 [Camellia sinensis]|uniref:Uncharacterized protein n=1 Tax=Camellia sinensis TaxID=4442 RepID=A0A7J7I9Z0_CAMSI|nr:hypothetical protein HYC85_002207 [Camellia sinensis]